MIGEKRFMVVYQREQIILLGRCHELVGCLSESYACMCSHSRSVENVGFETFKVGWENLMDGLACAS